MITTTPSTIERDLRDCLQGELRLDPMSQQLYATDASIYRFVPQAVVLPRTIDDVVNTLRICRKHNTPITARGAGTSLAGQTVGSGVQIDFSRYLYGIIQVDPEERWARVQPGVVLDDLNAELARYGLQFGPDVATSSRACIGGMIGNNSSGAHSVTHGLTSDHVLELQVLLSDGSTCQFRSISRENLEEMASQETLEGRLYREIPKLAALYAKDIEHRFPKIRRRVSGYNLDAFIDPLAPVDLTRLICGSEGTLALILEAKLNLVPLPKQKGCVLIGFGDIFRAAAAVPELLSLSPSAIELVDKLILDQTRDSIASAPARALLKGDPGSILIIEFYGDSEQEVHAHIDQVINGFNTPKALFVSPLLESSEQAKIWQLRKSGVGLLMSIKGDAKPYAFVEDTAVDPQHLEAYLREFYQIVTEHNTTAGWYGHASVGCLHIRPLIDLKSLSGRKNFTSLMERVSDLVLKFGGSLSGEHGDGIVRGTYLEKMFGSHLYQAFRRVKKLFDPEGLLNPGRVVDVPPKLENLRVLQCSDRIPQLDTHFDYSREGGFYRAIEMCSGVGQCRKTLSGSMCPSYMATREEANSTRGRANALRAALEGNLENGLSNRQLYQAMDLCLACKACKNECPSSVDMARYKYEFLNQYRKRNGSTLTNYLIARMDLLLKWLSPVAPIANILFQWRIIRWLSEKLLGFDRRRSFPRFVQQTFRHWFSKRPSSPNSNFQAEVILWVDCWMNHNEPQVGIAAVTLLEAAGFTVRLADTVCCGRPSISKGYLSRSVELATRNISALYPLLQQSGATVVGLEPSCLLTLRDEYESLLRGESRKQALFVSDHSLLIEEFLARLPEQRWERLPLKPVPQPVLVHGHCHQKALVGMDPLRSVLLRIPDLDVRILDTSCCGMAGSFGYEVEHYSISQACVERVLGPTLRTVEQPSIVLAPGFSCRHQIEHFAEQHAIHPAEFLAGLLLIPEKKVGPRPSIANEINTGIASKSE